MSYKTIFIKRLLQLIGVCGALMATLAACKRDLGNYNYSAVNAITITTDTVNADRLMVINNDSLVVKQGDTLKVNVLLSQTKESGDLSFSWLVTQKNSSNGNPGLYVIGNTRQLTARVLLLPGLYNLVVKATDNTTGVSYYKIFSLNVSTSPWGNEGWLVLQQQANGSDLSVITTRDGATRGSIYNNVYFLANGHKLPFGTNKVNVLSYNSSVGSQKVSFFYPGGGLQVRSYDFSDSSTNDNWFVVNSAPNFQVNGVVSGGNYEYLINNNQLYNRVISSVTIKNPPVLFGAPYLGSWTLSPYVMLANSTAGYAYTLYDQTNKCFLLYSANANTLLPNIADVPNKHLAAFAGQASDLLPAASGFDMNNIGRNLEYAENVLPLPASNGCLYDCFFRNDGHDSTWLYQVPTLPTGYLNNNTSGRFYLNPSNVTGINTAQKFAVPTHVVTKDKFYYVTNDVVYTCTVQTGAASTSAAAGINFPAGTKIGVMKVFKSEYLSAPATESKVLVVTTDETASGGGNKVYFFSIDINGVLNPTPVQVYTGFDKIVDITFKKGLGQ
ncbi:hypothetical protein A4D02_26620 [Niastella koreensis]|uniref:PKD domain containing protein n=2 Tax=Niastella koreensis TaxID=354356 RepID=G8TEJ2_NIAKG|nr:PKD-like family lipoprotein [Niastella koreensis]AEV99414.1 hypothetical protein Niako_3084 [Niastella koreensis GR20-10]OQP50016.1 hypothetical protein A4D02_26620 [Niastella koreensis]